MARKNKQKRFGEEQNKEKQQRPKYKRMTFKKTKLKSPANFSVAEEMQKRLDDPEFMTKVFKRCSKFEYIYGVLGEYLGHFIAVRNSSEPWWYAFKEKYTYEVDKQMRDKYGKKWSEKSSKIKAEYASQYYEEMIIDRESGDLVWDSCEMRPEIFSNILVDGYVTHSFNGVNLERVKEYGLGDPRIYDPDLEKDLNEFGAMFGESKYYEGQGNNKNETYYCAPGGISFRYACIYSPERLWKGPLEQDRSDMLPIIIGESRADYARRVLDKKLKELDNSEEEKKHIAEVGLRVIDAFCTKKSVIGLIPITSISDSYRASTTFELNRENPLLVDDILREIIDGEFYRLCDNPTEFFIIEKFSNLVNTTRIPPKVLEFIEVEDAFVLKQKWAMVNYGLQPGDKIDALEGKPYKEPEQTKPERVEKQVNQINQVGQKKFNNNLIIISSEKESKQEGGLNSSLKNVNNDEDDESKK